MKMEDQPLTGALYKGEGAEMGEHTMHMITLKNKYQLDEEDEPKYMAGNANTPIPKICTMWAYQNCRRPQCNYMHVEAVKKAVRLTEEQRRDNRCDWTEISRILYEGARDENHICLRIKLYREYPVPPDEKQLNKFAMDMNALKALEYERP